MLAVVLEALHLELFPAVLVEVGHQLMTKMVVMELLDWVVAVVAQEQTRQILVALVGQA
jgi:hypothetical protein